MDATSYTVGYRKGGTENFQWRKCTPVKTRDEAHKLAKEIELMGYPTHIYKTADLAIVGLPDTYS